MLCLVCYVNIKCIYYILLHINIWVFPGDSVVESALGQEDLLETEMATHSSILAWRIPWTEKPGGLQSMGSQSQTHLSD